MNTMPMMPRLTHRIVRFASSPGESGGSPCLFDWMMNAARSLTSWSLRLGLPPFAGIGCVFGSPGCGSRPLVMMAIRNPGSRGFATPGSLSMGFRVAPIPPSRPAPWHDVQFEA